MSVDELPQSPDPTPNDARPEPPIIRVVIPPPPAARDKVAELYERARTHNARLLDQLLRGEDGDE